MEGLQEPAAKVADAGESLPELLVKGIPADKLRLCRWYPMQSLGQPDINVESHRRRRQGSNSSMVERDRVLAQALEVFFAQPNRRRPEDALVGLLGKPQVEGAYELGVDLDGPSLFHHAHAHSRCGKTGELVFERAELLPVGFEAKRPGECGHRFLDIDDWRSGADCFGRKVDEYKSGLFAIRQSQPLEVAGAWVNGGTRLDAERRLALPAIPFENAIAGVLVRDSTLALNRVEEIDPVWRRIADRS